MPIYEYRCESCSHEFEVRRKFGEDSGAPCPRCEGEGRRIFSPVPVIFKCSGFYTTDHRKDGDNGSQSEKGGGSTTSENVSQKKSDEGESHGEEGLL